MFGRSASPQQASRQAAKRPGRTHRGAIQGLQGIVATGAHHRPNAWGLDGQHRLKLGEGAEGAQGAQGAQGALNVEALDPGVYVSFTKDDLTLRIERSSAHALAELRSDVGEPVFHVRLDHAERKTSAAPPWMRQLLSPTLYATPRTRLDDMPAGVRLVPGMALMRELLRLELSRLWSEDPDQLARLQPPFVTGLLLPGDEVQVLVLMVCSDEGDLEGWEYIPLAGVDIQIALSAFVQARHMSASGEWPVERTLIFGGEEIAPVLGRLKTYPSESDVFGVPLGTLYKVGALTLSGAAAATVVATAALSMWAQDLRATTSAARAQLTQLQQQQRDDLVVHRLGAYLQAQHVNPEQAIALAQAVWLPGALLSVNATPTQVHITAIYQNDAQASNPQGQAQRPLLDALSLELPSGCVREGMATSNTVQLLEVRYQCAL